MSIKKYEIGRPDSDGECGIDLEFSVDNKYDEDVMLIKYDVFHIAKNGYVIASDLRNSNECLLEKGDVEDLQSWGTVHQRYLGSGKEVSVQVQARLFKREFFKFGPFKIPENEEVAWLEAKIKSETINNDIKISLARSAPDDDGAVQIEIMTKIINMKNVYLESPELKVSLFDRTGAEIENNSDSIDLTPYSASILRPSCWGLKPKKIKGGTVEFSITIYQQIGMETIEGTANFVI